jgi:hypothetical protein
MKAIKGCCVRNNAIHVPELATIKTVVGTVAILESLAVTLPSFYP